MKPILKIVAICVICAATLMSGCMESEYEDVSDSPHDFVTQTPRIPAATPEPYYASTPTPTPGSVSVCIDEYMGGLHITGKAIYERGNLVEMKCNVEGYEDGMYVTGSMSQYGNNAPHFNLRADVDTYEDGLHMTGQMTLIGTDLADWRTNCVIEGHITGIGEVTGTYQKRGDNTPYYNVQAQIDTYSEGMHVTGTATLSGVASDEWYYDLTIDGHIDGWDATGTIRGKQSNARREVYYSHPIWIDQHKVDYVNMG